MEKEKIAVLKGSSQAALARIQIFKKLKEKLKYIHYLLFPSLTSSVFVPELDILNVNLTSQISLYL